MGHGFYAGQVAWPRDVSHGSTTKAHGSKHVIVGTLICWLVLGPSYVSENGVRFLLCIFSIFCTFFQYFVFCANQIKEKGPHPHFDVPVSPYTCVYAIALTRSMVSASSPASELAVQLTAPASSLAAPPPAASTAEPVDLSAEAVILEDPEPAATRTWVQILSCTRYCFVVPCI